MAQSYVGKHAISKGIGRAIRKFVAFAFSAHVLGHRRRACAVPDIQKRASHLVRGTLRSVFPAADAICWKTITWEIQKLRKLVQCCNGKVGRQPPPRWEGKRLRDAVRYGSMRHGAREERGRSALRKTGSGRPAIQVNKGLAALN